MRGYPAALGKKWDHTAVIHEASLECTSLKRSVFVVSVRVLCTDHFSGLCSAVRQVYECVCATNNF